MAHNPAEISASIDGLLASYTRPHQNIPVSETGGKLRCCCGKEDCAYLKYSNVALEGLEKDVRTAATLGQALLARHEQYMVDAENDRRQMAEKISKLEHEKKSLEFENERTTMENRGLSDQLEELNTSVEDAEAHIKALEATLLSTQQEMKKLDLLAARAGQLDIRVAELESERSELETIAAKTKEEERTAIRRWEEAGRDIFYLESQLETIEREANEEKARHAEIVNRMERQRAVEAELDSAARRLKGAAAMTTYGPGQKNNNVVSHFVKDILQDNANLQLGIMELREMLNDSNDEVQRLRDMITEHQPMENGQENQATQNLQGELTPKESSVVNQELHIHHHYHPVTRPVLKKKRVLINSGASTPNTSRRRPRDYDSLSSQNAGSRRQSFSVQPIPASATTAILSQTSITIPAHRHDNRWSTQTMSEFAASSAPTSPCGSLYGNSTVFESNMNQHLYDDSRPTSRGSSADGIMSPIFDPRRKSSMRCFTAPIVRHAIQEEGDDDRDDDVEELKIDQTNPQKQSQEYLHDKNSLGENNHHDLPSPTQQENNTDLETNPRKPKLHRSPSHESIISIHGQDIHTLTCRPSQLQLRPYNRNTPYLLSYRAPSPSISTSSETATGIAADGYGTGLPSALRRGTARKMNSSAYLRENFVAAGAQRGGSGENGDGSSRGLGRKVGGWLSSKWGVVSPLPSTSTITRVSATHLSVPDALPISTPALGTAKHNTTNKDNASIHSTQSSVLTTSSMTSSTSRRAAEGLERSVAETARLMGRVPGVNQRGAVPGFVRKGREGVDVRVEAVEVDLEGLRGALEE